MSLLATFNPIPLEVELSARIVRNRYFRLKVFPRENPRKFEQSQLLTVMKEKGGLPWPRQKLNRECDNRSIAIIVNSQEITPPRWPVIIRRINRYKQIVSMHELREEIGKSFRLGLVREDQRTHCSDSLHVMLNLLRVLVDPKQAAEETGNRQNYENNAHVPISVPTLLGTI